MYGTKKGFKMILLHVDIQLFQYHCWKDYLSPLNCLGTVVKSQLTINVMVYFLESHFCSIDLCLSSSWYNAGLISVALGIVSSPTLFLSKVVLKWNDPSRTIWQTCWPSPKRPAQNALTLYMKKKNVSLIQNFLYVPQTYTSLFRSEFVTG